MAKYTTYEVKGEKESFEDSISNISPTDVLFTRATGEKTVSNKTHQWQEDSLDTVAANAQVEGFDAVSDVKTPTVLRSNVSQIFAKTGAVTRSNDAQSKYGRAYETNYQKAKSVEALKRDIEHAYVGTAQTQVAGDAATARQMDSIQAQIAAGNTIDAAAAALDETMVRDAFELVFNAGGNAACLMVDPSKADIVASFTGKASIVNQIAGENKIDNSSTSVNGFVDGYTSQLGQAVRIEYNRFMKVTDALVLDTARIKRLAFRATKTTDLAVVGDSTPYMVVYEGSLMNENQSASALITNLA